VVAGFFDCMRVHQAGYPCVVALMGARLSAKQKDLLADRFPGVVLLLDGDPTGRAATLQIARDLASASSVTQVLLSPEMQPDRMAAWDIRYALNGGERRQEIRRKSTDMIFRPRRRAAGANHQPTTAERRLHEILDKPGAFGVSTRAHPRLYSPC
jgi:DNA primase